MSKEPHIHILKKMVFLATLLCLLSGCTLKAISQPVSPAPEFSQELYSTTIPNVQVRLQTFFPTSTRDYQTTPFLFHDTVLLTAFDAIYERQRGNITAVDIASGSESLLRFNAFEVQMDESYYYWLGDKGRIISTSKEDGRNRTLYTVPRGRNALPRISRGDGYLVWTEEIADDTALRWAIQALSVADGKVMQVAEVNHVFSYYTKVRIKNNCIAYSDLVDGQYYVIAQNLTQPSTYIKLAVEEEPFGFVFDGSVLAWSAITGSWYYSVEDQTTTQLVPSNMSAGDCDILLERFIVYATDTRFEIYDLQTKQTIFYKTQLPPYHYLAFFSTDEKSEKLVLTGYPSRESEEMFVAVLSLELADEGNGIL